MKVQPAVQTVSDILVNPLGDGDRWLAGTDHGSARRLVWQYMHACSRGTAPALTELLKGLLLLQSPFRWLCKGDEGSEGKVFNFCQGQEDKGESSDRRAGAVAIPCQRETKAHGPAAQWHDEAKLSRWMLYLTILLLCASMFTHRTIKNEVSKNESNREMLKIRKALEHWKEQAGLSPELRQRVDLEEVANSRDNTFVPAP